MNSNSYNHPVYSYLNYMKMLLFVVFNLLIVVEIQARWIQESCLPEASNCSRNADCCSNKCTYTADNLIGTCDSDAQYTNNIYMTIPLSVQVPTFCILYGNCTIDNDCCTKKCISRVDTVIKYCKPKYPNNLIIYD